MSLAGRVVAVQGALGLLCLAVFVVVDLDEGRAALMAMVTTLVPSAYYAWFQQRTLNATRLLLHGVYKVAATMTLIALSFAVLAVEPVGFFVTFGTMQLAYVAGLRMRSSN